MSKKEQSRYVQDMAKLDEEQLRGAFSKLDELLNDGTSSPVPMSVLPKILYDKAKKVTDFFDEKLTSIEKQYGPLSGDLQKLRRYVIDAQTFIRDYNQGKPNYERKYVLAAINLLNSYVAWYEKLSVLAL
jgi:hypothetical protein